MIKPKIQKNRGMTYAELIVVLSIFAIMSAVAIFNYGDFQANVDIKNFTSDVALQIVQAQKASLNGVVPREGAPSDTWKPSYGVYFDLREPGQFLYFADLDNLGYYSGSGANPPILLKKGYKIANIEECDSDDRCDPTGDADFVSVVFKRPDSSAIFFPELAADASYFKIIIESPNGKQGFIKIFPSGRVQVN